MQLLSSLIAVHPKARTAAAQAIAKVGKVDIPDGQWTTLVPSLVAQVLNPAAGSELKSASVTALGFLCEELVRTRRARFIRLLLRHECLGQPVARLYTARLQLKCATAARLCACAVLQVQQHSRGLPALARRILLVRTDVFKAPPSYRPVACIVLRICRMRWSKPKRIVF